MRQILTLTFALSMAFIVNCSDSPTDSSEAGRRVRVPGDAATIQAAIDIASVGDTVLVAAGHYAGEGNRDIDFEGKSITLRSVAGPLETRIICSEQNGVSHTAFTTITGDVNIVIDGFTITGAESGNGAALNLTGTSPTIRNCIFTRNRATASGGAVRCKGASPKFVNCTFVDNGAPAGGAIYLLAGSNPRFESCIIAYSNEGGAIGTHGGADPEFVCSNLYGNVGGDWTGVAAGQLDADGNISLDPQFFEIGDYRLSDGSPCLPSNNDCSVLIGAVGR